MAVQAAGIGQDEGEDASGGVCPGEEGSSRDGEEGDSLRESATRADNLPRQSSRLLVTQTLT